MDLQLIFVVETNKKCNSDWIYIKETINRFYKLDEAHIKLSTIYMDGKGSYKNKIKEVENEKSRYNLSAQNRKSVVIYCFDCDNYENDPEDEKFLKEARDFCNSRDYSFVWFCKDIESVYLGRKVPKCEKKDAAVSFKAKKQILTVKKETLLMSSYKANTSNILSVLDEFLERK